MKKPTKKQVRAAPAPALTVENLAVAVERGVRAAIRPETPAPPADQYAPEKAQQAVTRVSPITRAVDALEGLHNLEARVHTLMANVVGEPSDGASGTTGKESIPSGVFNVLDLAAADAFARTDRIHQMLDAIERALP